MRPMLDIYRDRLDVMLYLRTLCERQELSWKAFMDIFHPHILAIVKRCIPCDFDREDVSQVIYEKLLENDMRLLCQYDGNYQNFVFYLRKIARNVIRSYCKKNRRNNGLRNVDHYEHDLADDRQDIELEVLNEEKENLFYDSLKDLKPAYREVIFMLVEGYSHREIAEKLEIPINTVLTRSARGKLQLKNMVQQKYS